MRSACLTASISMRLSLGHSRRLHLSLIPRREGFSPRVSSGSPENKRDVYKSTVNFDFAIEPTSWVVELEPPRKPYRRAEPIRATTAARLFDYRLGERDLLQVVRLIAIGPRYRDPWIARGRVASGFRSRSSRGGDIFVGIRSRSRS